MTYAINTRVQINREWLVEEIERAEEEAAESHKDAMNSYGAGYDGGYLAALKAVLAQSTEPQTE